MTRALANRGFVDPIGLAAASLGAEARLELLRTNYAPAIELYLEQLAAGDDGAALSLQFLAARASLRAPAGTIPERKALRSAAPFGASTLTA